MSQDAVSPRVLRTPRLPPLPDTHPQPGDQIDPGFNHAEWQRINHEQLGVNVVDPDGHVIGMAQTNRTFLGFDTGGWSPVDGRKHVMVGELDYYSFYDPFGDEADFNLHIFPNAQFRFLLDDVVAMMSSSQRRELHDRRRGPGHTVEAEITPDEEYYNNFWFPADEHGRSQLDGATIGVYGAWVRDWSHEGRPEIHPSEVIWFRNGSVDNLAGRPQQVRHVRWTVIVLRDDSNRFDRISDYDIGLNDLGSLSELKRPWSASPRRARITFALLGIRGKHLNYRLSMADGHRVFAWPGEDTRSVTATAVDMQTAVTVTKAHSRRAEFKVRLGRLRQDPADANLFHCFMSLDLQVGEGDRGKEGFAEVSLEAWADDPNPGDMSGNHPVTTPRPRPGPTTNDPNAPREP